MKKLLILSYTFPPQQTPESILLAKLVAGLLRHRSAFVPVVICVDEQTTCEKCDPKLLRMLPQTVRRERLPSPERKRFMRACSFILPCLKKLPDRSSWWTFANRRRIVQVCRKYKPDVLYSHSHYLGSHILALRVKQRLGIPWIAHFSDPWTRNPYVQYGVCTAWLNRRWERAVISHADRLVFVTPQLRDFVMQPYPPSWKRKCVVIPHPYDPSLYPPPARRIRDLRKRRRDAPIIISAVGNFYGQRTPYPILTALTHIKRSHPALYAQLKVQFIGNIPSWQKFHPLYRHLFQEHASQIVHIPTVSYADSLAYMQASDILLLIEADIQPAIFLPSKLIDYLGTGKPILGITPRNSPAAKLLTSLQNPAIPPSDTLAIARACVQIISAIHAGKSTYFYAPSSIMRYNIKTTTTQFLKELENVMHGTNPSC